MQHAIPAVPEPVNYGLPIYAALSKLKGELALPVKRRDRVEIMICAAIFYGFDQRHMIYKKLRSNGLSPDHFQRVLLERTGSAPSVHLWEYDESTRKYRLLEGVVTSVSNGMVVVNTD